jgi:DNA-binding PadR family transcriptional regulator
MRQLHDHVFWRADGGPVEFEGPPGPPPMPPHGPHPGGPVALGWGPPGPPGGPGHHVFLRGGWGPPRQGPRVRPGDVRAAALALLAEQPRNGYQIMQEIAQRSGQVWRPSSGSVYPALQQLEDEGLVRAEEHEGRRRFALTEAGRTYVDEHPEEVSAPWEAVAETVDDAARELHEIQGQLGLAVMQVAQAATPAQVAEARRILVDARRALYRLLAEGDAEPVE